MTGEENFSTTHCMPHRKILLIHATAPRELAVDDHLSPWRAPGREKPVVGVVTAQEPEPRVGGLRQGRGQLPVAPRRRPRRGLQLVRRRREGREPHPRHARPWRGGGGLGLCAAAVADDT
jgi:hypothetical protein